MDDRVKHGLPPIAQADARLFILGSLPGDASLAERKYYAHPRNNFWRLLGGVIGEDLQSLDYQTRLERLQAHGIGLWDVVARAWRRGSLDQAIRGAGQNPLAGFFAGYPFLEAVAFNGAAAAAAGHKLLDGVPDLMLVDLPSSSPANTRPFAEKLQSWRQLGRYCGERPCP